ncbi:MAG: hypothetical protein BMS9Abin11_0197 [Gammaproteobacteria bacterium]|nr:MAG: hypothetical protein BMS9Abin11_0197 [Gammaproteobacteria bacterium]
MVIPGKFDRFLLIWTIFYDYNVVEFSPFPVMINSNDSTCQTAGFLSSSKR